MFLHLSVILLTGGCAWLLGGACVVALGGDVHGFLGGVCVFFWGGMRGFFLGGACIGYDEIRSMSRQYASYWNAFLFR